MKKIKRKAFGKDVYFLGKDTNNTAFWLVEPTWDCDWYWGCGYIQSYTTNMNPELARDVNSHQHADDFYPKWMLVEDPIIKETPLNETEQWELCDLLKSMYTLKEVAKLYGRGNSHITSTNRINIKCKEQEERINKIELPKIFNAIRELLSPEEEGGTE